jgi:rhodanese-related sulfurtransferase
MNAAMTVSPTLLTLITRDTRFMKSFKIAALAAALAFTAIAASAQQAAAPWKYKTQRLARAEVDALLAQPGGVLVLDVRRPDELIKYGSFPVFLSIQNRDIEKQLAWLPRDRRILTVSNHAQRAGAVGDLLASKGYQVAGATGSEDYEQEGGTAVSHIQPPAPRAAASAAAP